MLINIEWNTEFCIIFIQIIIFWDMYFLLMSLIIFNLPVLLKNSWLQFLISTHNLWNQSPIKSQCMCATMPRRLSCSLPNLKPPFYHWNKKLGKRWKSPLKIKLFFSMASLWQIRNSPLSWRISWFFIWSTWNASTSKASRLRWKCWMRMTNASNSMFLPQWLLRIS